MTFALKLFGPPGTGKTHMLRRAARKALADGILPNQLGAISFTRAAAGELRERLAQDFAMDPEDLKGVGTIHSLARRTVGASTDRLVKGKALKEFMEAFHFDFNEQAYTETNDDHFADQVADVSKVGNFCLAFYDWFRATLQRDLERAMLAYKGDVPRADKRGALAAVKRFVPAYEGWLKETQQWDFASLLIRVCAERASPPDWRALMIDEAQDLSPLLMTVVRLWTEGRERVILAGDPNQAIYTWQGASPRLFEQFPCETTHLVESHRLPTELVDFARRVLFAGGDARDFPWEGRAVIPETHGTLFLLTRTRRLLGIEANALMLDGTPFSALRGLDPLRQNACKAVYAALRLGAKGHCTLKDLERIFEQVPSAPWLVRGAKANLQRTIVKRGILAVVRLDELESLGLQPRLLELIAEQNPWAAFGKADTRLIDYYRRVVLIHGAEALVTEPKITLSTIHGAKGHERDGVLVVNDWAGKPYGSLWNGDREDRAGEFRVGYVAVTRAKHSLEIRNQGRRQFPFPHWRQSA